ncbi:hypothetical protein OVN20_12965 [Microcella daejeonensis]|uniref:hypothetical protein n=1 Tax=Microcella daejeonensis TaxID=2994971 RepID=UPI00226EED81|nr:hypothetical protein [Microcella daejeonensis]WAB83922.1 hypothetical protein OVN20_12965 [Microcella daejeonensis]
MPALRTRSVATALLAAGLVLGTTACTGTPLDNIVEGVVGSGVDQVTEGIDESVRGLAEDVLGGAELSTDGELPSTFPQGIPLLGGEILGGAGGPDGAGWVARIRIDEAAAFEGARAALEGAGFTASNVSSDATSAFGTFTSAEYIVNLAIATTNGETTATYVVTPV